MGQVLLNLATQFGGYLKDSVVVLHHESHQFGGQQLIQIHLIYWAQNTVGEHLYHLDMKHKIKNKLPATIITLIWI